MGHDYASVPYCCNSFCIFGQRYHNVALYSSNHKVLYCYGFGLSVLQPAIRSKCMCKHACLDFSWSYKMEIKTSNTPILVG